MDLYICYPNIQSSKKGYSWSSKYSVCGFFKKHFTNFYLSYLNPKKLKGLDKGTMTSKSFLVNLGNNFSHPAPVSCSVPQGSILVPPLFLIFVNGMNWLPMTYKYKELNSTQFILSTSMSNALIIWETFFMSLRTAIFN